MTGKTRGGKRGCGHGIVAEGVSGCRFGGHAQTKQGAGHRHAAKGCFYAVRSRPLVMTERATDQQWLTYVEASEALGITVEAVRALTRRQKWPRQRPNGIGQVVRVLVPTDRMRSNAANGQTDGRDDALQRANERAERAERQVEVLRAKLVAARYAGELVRAEVADLRARLNASDEERRQLIALVAGRRRSWWRWWRKLGIAAAMWVAAFVGLGNG